jgi:pre-mRNA-splicing helicase BRR2
MCGVMLHSLTLCPVFCCVVQCRRVASDLLAYSASEEEPTQFLHCSKEDIEPALKPIKNRALAACLQSGVGFYHKGLSDKEKSAVETLFRAGAVQVLVVEQACCWGMGNLWAHLVVIMGTQFYDGNQHRYVDCPISDVLQMMGRANRYALHSPVPSCAVFVLFVCYSMLTPCFLCHVLDGVVRSPLQDTSAKCSIFCVSSKKDFYKKFLYDPLPIESHLDHYLHDHLNAEIISKRVESVQDAVDYLTWSFLYRRVTQNPNYYNLAGVTNRHLSVCICVSVSACLWLCAVCCEFCVALCSELS